MAAKSAKNNESVIPALLKFSTAECSPILLNGIINDKN